MFQPGQQVTVIDGGWTGIIVRIDSELQAAYIQFPGRPDKLAYAFEAIAPAGRDDTQDTRDNPRAAGAASDRGAQPLGQQAMREILDRDQIDGAFLLGRAIGHEAGLNRFGLPHSTASFAPIIAAAGMTPAQRVVLIKAARTAQTFDAMLAGH